MNCRDSHPEHFRDNECIIGYCVSCGNTHCAFDLCDPAADAVAVITIYHSIPAAMRLPKYTPN